MVFCNSDHAFNIMYFWMCGCFTVSILIPSSGAEEGSGFSRENLERGWHSSEEGRN